MATEIKRLKIRSVLKFAEGDTDTEINETDTECELSRRGDDLLVRYKEGEASAECAVRIHYFGGALSVKREGAVRSELKFKAGERLGGAYAVGAYEFDAEVYTKALDFAEADGRIALKLAYEMTLGGVLRNCEMQISLI